MFTRTRLAALLCAALAVVASASAQESVPGEPSYINCEWGFAIIFPSPPMTRDIRYTTHTGAMVPARQFYVERGQDRFMVTVAKFSDGPIIDERAMDHAAAALKARGEVRNDEVDAAYDPGFPGRQVNIFLPNNRQLRGSVYMIERKLFITEAEAERSDFAALQFEQSLTLVDPKGVDYDQNPGDPLRVFTCR